MNPSDTEAAESSADALPTRPARRRCLATGDSIAPVEPSTPGPSTPGIGMVVADRYVLERLLGIGGMGRVYLARHRHIGKPLAVKLLRRSLARDLDQIERFMREARAASSVGSEHIVDVIDAGQLPDGTAYLTMEYLEGETVADRIEREAPLDTQTLCRIGVQLCEGLGAAHRLGIVHRDLKPENVMLVKHPHHPIFCKIVDFGIAKVRAWDVDDALTVAGAVFGTPHYMAPEQAAGSPLDHRADLYALGVMLYEMASGRLPFDYSDPGQLIAHHITSPPRPLATLAPHRPDAAACDAVILKCLAKNPDDRYQSAGELAAALVALDERSRAARDTASWTGPGFAAGRSDTMIPVWQRATVPSGAPPSRSPRGMLAAMALALAIASLAAGWSLYRRSPPAAALAISGLPPPVMIPQTEHGARIHTVELRSAVEGAVARIDGRDRPLPVHIQVIAGETAAVEIRAPGHAAAVLQLDGSRPRIDVELEPTERRAVRRGRPSKAGEIVNPWAR